MGLRQPFARLAYSALFLLQARETGDCAKAFLVYRAAPVKRTIPVFVQ